METVEGGPESAPRDDVAREYGRFFLCGRCRKQVLICSDCDRGQIYCTDGCAQRARREAQRAAGRRYQASERGRLNHAARARRYRARQKRVTHHGLPAPQAGGNVLVLKSAIVADRSPCPPGLPRRLDWHCHCCRCACSQFVRQMFLRRHRALRAIARASP
jgi:hypothetical protein